MAARKSSAPKLEHLEGCPGERVEEYDTRRPSGEPVHVERCLDCGGALTTTTTTLGDPAEDTETPEA